MNIVFDDKQKLIMESDRISIKEVFHRYIGGDINKRGFCKCPFHNEKTASFMLYEKNKSFYCFGCGAGGNVINLVAKVFNITYYEAMKRLDEDYSLGLFQKVIKTETRRSKETVERARKQLKQEQLQLKQKDNYFKLLDYFKELQKMPLTKAVSYDLAFLERLLDKWLRFENKPFDRVPEDFDADALIYALKSKHREEVGNG